MKTSINFKIGAEGPLFNKEIERCFVKIEISKREKVYNSKTMELKTSYSGILGFNMNVMSEKEILAEKVRAILTRKQARDLFDLYFLFNKNTELDINLINKKLEYYKKTFDKKDFVKAIKNNQEIWINELNPFVFGNLPTFKDVLGKVYEKIDLKS